MITPLPLNRGFIRVCSLYYFIMYSVWYTYDEIIDGEDSSCTGDGGTYHCHELASSVARTLINAGYPAQVRIRHSDGSRPLPLS